MMKNLLLDKQHFKLNTMKEENFNPLINAVVSIRHLAISASNNWTAMNSKGSVIKSDIDDASNLIHKYGSEKTKNDWQHEIDDFTKNLNQLKTIMASAISKIKQKSADSLSKDWMEYPQYAFRIEHSFKNLEKIGVSVLPENEKLKWIEKWALINKIHHQIKSEADACNIHLQLIEEHNPEEIDELTATILKHIPMKYSIGDAEKYTNEYMEAYEAIKREASQKKNLWDKFLDILAGGTQQTPAQRVMMQRWVNGEKGDNTL